MQTVNVRLVRRYVSVLGLGCLVACQGSVESDPSFSAMVQGSVTRGTGVPVPGARITYVIFDLTHNTSMPPVDGQPWPSQTNGAGQFSAVLGFFLYGPFVGRVEVTVHPPAGSGLYDSTVVVDSLQFSASRYHTATVVVTYP